MKNQKGITLIALVITIIVLLILAGVSIAMLTGENGLLNRAKSAGAASQVSDAKEQVSLTVNELVSEYYEEKYVNGNTTGTTGTVEAYVASKLKTSLDSKYATAAEYTADAATVEITLVPTDENGTAVKGTYNVTTEGKKGTIDWTDASNS